MSAALARFWAGAAGAVLAGFVAFRGSLFDMSHPAFECLTVGIVAAAVFALVRCDRPGHAIVVVTVFAVLRLGLIQTQGWLIGLSGLVLGGGILLTAVLFDMLGRRGIAFGKFAVAGALLGGVYLAVAPMVEFAGTIDRPAIYVVLRSVFVGVVVGDGVGLGIELAELVGSALGRARVVAD